MARATGPAAGVLFDMDGLLVDTEPLWFEVEREVMARLGGEWTERGPARPIGGSLQRSVGYLLAGPAARRPQKVADWLMAAWPAARERGP